MQPPAAVCRRQPPGEIVSSSITSACFIAGHSSFNFGRYCSIAARCEGWTAKTQIGLFDRQPHRVGRAVGGDLRVGLAQPPHDPAGDGDGEFHHFRRRLRLQPLARGVDFLNHRGEGLRQRRQRGAVLGERLLLSLGQSGGAAVRGALLHPVGAGGVGGLGDDVLLQFLRLALGLGQQRGRLQVRA